jgi:hypothetical protein
MEDAENLRKSMKDTLKASALASSEQEAGLDSLEPRLVQVLTILQ